MKRKLLVVGLIVALLCVAAAPMGAGVALADTPDNESTGSNGEPNGAEDENPDFDETADTDDDTPGIADRVRVDPIPIDEDWMGVETQSTGEEFETEGPFALFSISEPADNVRVQQSGADARLHDGDQTIHVDFDEDAAPADNSTFFEVEVFFEDGSTHQMELYATQTGVSVAAAELTTYEGLISQMEEDAADRGFGTDAAGLEEYHQWQMDRVELVESFLVERAEQLFATLILTAENPLAWVIALLSIAVITYKRERDQGFILRRIENDSGKTARKQERHQAAYNRSKDTANEEPISDLDKINVQQAQYWSDTFDIFSVRQLAELARKGPVDKQDELMADGGEPRTAIGQIDAENIEDSWLAPVFSTNRLADSQEALSNIRAALIRMENKYGMRHIYRDARSDVEAALEIVRKEQQGANR